MKFYFLISVITHFGLYLFLTQSPDFSRQSDMIEVELTSNPPIISKSRSIKKSDSLSPAQSNQKSLSGNSNLSIQNKEMYLSQIYQLVKKQQTYPIISKKLNEQGLVKVLLTIESSGSLKKVELIEASPYQRLNDAAMQAAARAAPFDPFPEDVNSESWQIAVPVQFLLN